MGEREFSSALTSVMRLEISLRRVVRFELMKLYGRHWLVNSGDIFSTLESRIDKDRRSGMYVEGTSELSYLSLSELTSLIFKICWQPVFRSVFSDRLYLQKDLQRLTIPLRNKIAHFRPVSREDLFNLRTTDGLLESLSAHYTSESLTSFHIPSDPEYVNDWIDPETERKAISELEGHGFKPVWEATTQLNNLRTYGYSLGAGIYCGHFFIEIFSDTYFPIVRLNQFMCRQTYEITFMTLKANKLRVFFSLRNDPRECSKKIRSLGKVLSLNQGNLSQDETDLVSEYFVGPSLAPQICFAI